MSQQRGCYYDIDDILSEETRVPTRFLVNASQLGHFVPGNEVQRKKPFSLRSRFESKIILQGFLAEGRFSSAFYFQDEQRSTFRFLLSEGKSHERRIHPWRPWFPIHQKTRLAFRTILQL